MHPGIMALWTCCRRCWRGVSGWTSSGAAGGDYGWRGGQHWQHQQGNHFTAIGTKVSLAHTISGDIFTLSVSVSVSLSLSLSALPLPPSTILSVSHCHSLCLSVSPSMSFLPSTTSLSVSRSVTVSVCLSFSLCVSPCFLFEFCLSFKESQGYSHYHQNDQTENWSYW